MNPNTERSWVPFPLVLPFFHFLKRADQAASTFFHLIIWWYDMKLHEIAGKYDYVTRCTLICIYIYDLYTHILMYAKTMLLYMQANKKSMFFFPSSSPQRLPLARYFLVNYLDFIIGYNEREAGWLREWPWSAENPYAPYGMFTIHENHKWESHSL